MENKRNSERLTKNVKCEVHSTEMTFSSTIDVSDGGLFISTPEPLKEGTEIDLILHIPGEGTTEIKGTVKWAREDETEDLKSGMGIEFSGDDSSNDDIKSKLMK
ncbi:MAG: PilZ domain-containing protein [bacterium]|nr:PilZ domain-containing protein [bacterium]